MSKLQLRATPTKIVSFEITDKDFAKTQRDNLLYAVMKSAGMNLPQMPWLVAADLYTDLARGEMWIAAFEWAGVVCHHVIRRSGIESTEYRFFIAE